jgi:hypothetical protein
MAFVPTPFIPPPEASPQARDLANRLTQVIQQFRQQYPALTDDDIRAALRLATGPSSERSHLPLLAAGLGVVAAVLIGLMTYLGQSRGHQVPSFAILAIIAAVAIGALLARARR